MRVLGALLVIVALVAPACGGSDAPGPVTCTPSVEFGIVVQLVDATTRAPVAGATLALREGGYSEVMQELTAGTYAGAAERAGTYRLTVQAAGYDEVVREGIVVTADVCHVVTVGLQIELTRP